MSGLSYSRHAAPCRRGYDILGRRHHRRLAAALGLVLAAGAQRRRAEAPAQGAARRTNGLRPRQPRRVRAPVLRPDLRRHRDQAADRSIPPPTASAISSSTATSSTSSSVTRSGSPISATGPTPRRCSSTPISTPRAGRLACPIGRFRPGRSSRSRTPSISSARSRRSLRAKPNAAASTASSAAISTTR